MHFVARLDRTYARRRTGIDEVAGLERVVLGEVSDLLGHRPDHVAEVRLLALLAVYVEPDGPARRMADLGRRHQPAAGRGLVEVLAEIPRPAVVLAPLLQVAARHVQAHGIEIGRASCRERV